MVYWKKRKDGIFMKLSVLTVPLQGIPADQAFSYLHSLGVEQVELGTGGYTVDCHVGVADCLSDESKLHALQNLLAKNELTISALSCHGNPVHPDKATADGFHQVFVDTCRLAQKLGVETVVTFSGCPGDCFPGYANVVCQLGNGQVKRNDPARLLVFSTI